MIWLIFHVHVSMVRWLMAKGQFTQITKKRLTYLAVQIVLAFHAQFMRLTSEIVAAPERWRWVEFRSRHSRHWKYEDIVPRQRRFRWRERRGRNSIQLHCVGSKAEISETYCIFLKSTVKQTKICFAASTLQINEKICLLYQSFRHMDMKAEIEINWKMPF